MAALTNAAETALLSLLFTNVDWANVGDAAGLQNSATAGVFWMSLHTADPGEAGNQTTSEISYTGYGRQSLARSGVGFTVSGDNVSNASQLQFGACTAGSGTALYVGVGSDSTGAGNLFMRAPINTPASGLAVSAGINPTIAANELDFNAA